MEMCKYFLAFENIKRLQIQIKIWTLKQTMTLLHEGMENMDTTQLADDGDHNNVHGSIHDEGTEKEFLTEKGL